MANLVFSKELTWSIKYPLDMEVLETYMRHCDSTWGSRFLSQSDEVISTNRYQPRSKGHCCHLCDSFVSIDECSCQAFSREAVVWRQLSHPNLLPFYGVFYLGDRNDRLCLVSPCMKNGNIIEFLQQNPGAERLPLVSLVITSSPILKPAYRYQMWFMD